MGSKSRHFHYSAPNWKKSPPLTFSAASARARRTARLMQNVKYHLFSLPGHFPIRLDVLPYLSGCISDLVSNSCPSHRAQFHLCSVRVERVEPILIGAFQMWELLPHALLRGRGRGHGLVFCVLNWWSDRVSQISPPTRHYPLPSPRPLVLAWR